MRTQRRDLQLVWGQVSCLEWAPEQPSHGTVLLLHGGGVDSAELSWGEVGPALAEAGYRVFAPDHPGFGESSKAPWTATQDRLVAYVGELVTALGLSRYAIGGLSLGGGLTLGHLLAAPEGVSGALVFGSYGFMPFQSSGPFRRVLHALTWGLLKTGALTALTRAYGNSRERMAKGLEGIIRNSEQRTPALLDAVMAAVERHGIPPTFEEWQRDQIGFGRLKTDYTDALTSLRLPVLVVHGDHDSGVPIDRARLAARLLPQGQLLEIADAGHWVQRDRPDLVIPAVLGFLASLGPSAGDLED